MKLSGEGYSPVVVRQMVSQGARYAFAEAAHNLEELAQLKVSGRHVLRVTERVGAEWVQRRDQEIEDYKQDRLPRLYLQAPRAAAIMLDGGRVQTREAPSPPGVRNPQWNEPKYGCFLTLDTRRSSVDPQPAPPAKFLDEKCVSKLVPQLQSMRATATTREGSKPNSAPRKPKRRVKRMKRHLLRTVIATMAAVDEFGFQVAVEAFKRGLDLAERKGCVCDGQKSNWTVWAEHLKDLGFIPILDFLHLLTYLYVAAHALGGTEKERWERYRHWLTWAWGGCREKLMLALNDAVKTVGNPPEGAPETDRRCVVAKSQTYVANNLEKMDYPRYRKLGLPISSAPIESTIKQFNKRVKGTEKFWRRDALEAVLQVRAAQLCEDGRTERLWATPRPYRPARPSRRAA